MTRVAQHLTAVALAGGLVTGTVFTAGPAMADTFGTKDGLVAVHLKTGDINVLNINAAATFCGLQVSAVNAIDGTDQVMVCKKVQGASLQDNS
jgi:hypothetical protein